MRSPLRRDRQHPRLEVHDQPRARPGSPRRRAQHPDRLARGPGHHLDDRRPASAGGKHPHRRPTTRGRTRSHTRSGRHRLRTRGHRDAFPASGGSFVTSRGPVQRGCPSRRPSVDPDAAGAAGPGCGRDRRPPALHRPWSRTAARRHSHIGRVGLQPVRQRVAAVRCGHATRARPAAQRPAAAVHATHRDDRRDAGRSRRHRPGRGRPVDRGLLNDRRPRLDHRAGPLQCRTLPGCGNGHRFPGHRAAMARPHDPSR